MKRGILFLLGAIFLLSGPARAAEEPAVGYAHGEGGDLYAPFQRAAAGKPLRLLVLGGSITQAGEGWIGEALRKAFPDASVSVVNAGMSAMGSVHAAYRLRRDVIDNDPDLVLIEFTVNDGDGKPEAVACSVESLVRALKSLPNPPAVVMIEAASRGRAVDAVPPQRTVGLHYGLLNIDLNRALSEMLAATGGTFGEYMGDDVHPNRRGHDFYGEAIMAALKPYLRSGGDPLPERRPLPPQLSELPLIRDGRLAAIPPAGSWKTRQANSAWYGRFFLGTVASKQPGDVLEIPFRGTSAGLFFEMSPANGELYASVDGAPPVPVNINSRSGYSCAVVAEGLEPGEHILRVVIPAGGAGKNGAQLGYLMVAGDPGARGGLAPQGEWTARKLAGIRSDTVPVRCFAWQGPFGTLDRKWPSSDTELKDLHRQYPPDVDPASNEGYKKLEGEELLLDFSRLTGFRDRGVVYAKTVIRSPEARTVRMRLVLDYYAKILLNGKPVAEIVTHHGNPAAGSWIELPLEAGRNELVFKIHSGSGGCALGVQFPDSGATGLVFETPLD